MKKILDNTFNAELVHDYFRGENNHYSFVIVYFSLEEEPSGKKAPDNYSKNEGNTDKSETFLTNEEIERKIGQRKLKVQILEPQEGK